MSICHQGSWCLPGRLVTAALVGPGAGKAGGAEGEPVGSFSFGGHTWLQSNLEKELQETFHLSARPFLENQSSLRTL